LRYKVAGGIHTASKGSHAVTEAVQVQLRKGVLELCVLALLSRGDAYGYEIASRLAKGIGMGEGTIYPLMRRMQADGLVETYLVESPSGPSRKYYRLTASGRTSFQAQLAEWAQFSQAVNEILGAAS
jgi:PadR family transcriptional regulator, regulatory protein PadR